MRIINLVAERARRRVEAEVPTGCHQDNRLTDEQYEAQVERVRALVDELVPLMGLSEYTIRLLPVSGPVNGDAVLSIGADWRYQFATITASIDLCAEETDEELMYDVLHEGAHAHLDLVRPVEVNDDHRNREELAATKLGRTGLNLYVAGCDKGRAESAEEIANLQAEIEDLQARLAAYEDPKRGAA